MAPRRPRDVDEQVQIVITVSRSPITRRFRTAVFTRLDFEDLDRRWTNDSSPTRFVAFAIPHLQELLPRLFRAAVVERWDAELAHDVVEQPELGAPQEPARAPLRPPNMPR